MLSSDHFQRKRKELQKSYDLLSEKISLLRDDYVIANQTEDKFRLKKEIQRAEAEREEILIEIEQLEAQVGTPPIPPVRVRAWPDWVAQEKPAPAQLVECAARLCELLAADHTGGTWHQVLKPADVRVDEEGNLNIQAANQIPAGAEATSERAADLRSVGFLLYEALVGGPPPTNKAERTTALVKVKGLSPSLIRLLLRATDEPPDWPDDDPTSWAELVRATQTGCLLVDRLDPQQPWSVELALALAIKVGETIQVWHKEGYSYLPPAAELILLEETDATSSS